MKSTFDILQATRNLVLKTIDGLSLEQLNKIPTGFNNNIAWNVAHLVVTQQLLNYGLSDTPFLIKNDLIEKYRKGTAPQEDLTQEEWNEIVSLFKSIPEQLADDYCQEDMFTKFKTYPTSYGYELSSIEDAIEFNNVHEALHLGYIMALKKSL